MKTLPIHGLDGDCIQSLRVDEALQYELLALTLCLRKESRLHSRVTIQVPAGDGLYGWKYGQLYQVMTMGPWHCVNLSITYWDGGNLETDPIRIHNIGELNHQGRYFSKEGLGDAEYILKLPAEAEPRPFDLAETA